MGKMTTDDWITLLSDYQRCIKRGDNWEYALVGNEHNDLSAHLQSLQDELEAAQIRIKANEEDWLARQDQEREAGEMRLWSQLSKGIDFADALGNIYRAYYDNGDSSVGISASWVCDEEFSTPEMVEEAIKDALAEREKEVERLKKEIRSLTKDIELPSPFESRGYD